jgi:hypothetical protein
MDRGRHGELPAGFERRLVQFFEGALTGQATQAAPKGR